MFFFCGGGGERHDNIILNVQILQSKHFVVIAQPRIVYGKQLGLLPEEGAPQFTLVGPVDGEGVLWEGWFPCMGKCCATGLADCSAGPVIYLAIHADLKRLNLASEKTFKG